MSLKIDLIIFSFDIIKMESKLDEGQESSIKPPTIVNVQKMLICFSFK